MITANEIRQKFIDFFVENSHTAEQSSSLVPREDPTLLFTNAGMVQFKKVFLGQDKRPYTRAVTSQKCLRVGGKHNDLENVGRTARHHTFFEMLGNFSFGDYFKEEAVRLAWKFLTGVLALPKDRLYVTIYKDDDEAGEIWKKIAGVPAERIFRLGDKDNFWSMGDTGPCGPCSEIIFDQGEHMTCGPNCGIGKCDCDRFLEIWNLVFMQFDQLASGERVPLPRPSIDTGMGLERITAVCQGVNSNFDIDLFQGIIGEAARLAGVKYGQSEDINTALRVIADHSRAMTFLITEGILPSNEGRGYVLRRLIRRACRFGRLIGLREPFLYQTALKVVELMGQAFPEISKSSEFLARAVREEEERFSDTLDKGLELLEIELSGLKQSGKSVLPGEVAFKLYDTYGFPLDIVNDVVEKQGVRVDEPGYQACMSEQKARAKKAWKGSGEVDPAERFLQLLESGIKSKFSGYDKLEDKGKVLALLSAEGELSDRITQGHGGYVITDITPFYGESGGQLGDKGGLETLTGVAEVLDALKPGSELTAHKVFVNEGEILLEQEASLKVEEGPRLDTARNHTTTHLLHAALRKVLGEHVKQAGSLVGPDRLRFDFSHISGLSAEELAAVEEDVNRAILRDVPVVWKVTSRDEANAAGAMALFGEKYGSEVRMVEIEGESTELCGGTHLRATGQAGSFYILSESGVAAGVRRIEAATGVNALEFARRNRAELEDAAALLRAKPGEIAGKLKAMQAQIKTLTKEKETLSAKLASGQGADLMEGLREVAGVKLLCAKVEASDVKALRESMDNMRSRLASGVICLAAEAEGKVMLILAVSQDLHGRFTAGKLIKDVAAPVGGSGGGRPDMAQAGGTNPAGIDEAFAKLEELISK